MDKTMKQELSTENLKETLRMEIVLDGDLKDRFLRRKESEKLDKNATLGKKLIALELERGEIKHETVTQD
jgi:hypothetical protein